MDEFRTAEAEYGRDDPDIVDVGESLENVDEVYAPYEDPDEDARERYLEPDAAAAEQLPEPLSTDVHKTRAARFSSRWPRRPQQAHTSIRKCSAILRPWIPETR